jgi:hypothetical protein
MTQQTERDDALIAEKKRLADDLERLAIGGDNETKLCMRNAAALLRGDEPAKPDRYVVAAREFLAAWYCKSHGLFDDKENFQAAAAVLRKHFSLPSDVIEAAEWVGFHVQSWTPEPREKVKRLLDFLFILKGDQ